MASVPLYPFILLGAIFLAVLILPPLVAAYIDHRRELRRKAVAAKGTARNESGAKHREQVSRSRRNGD